LAEQYAITGGVMLVRRDSIPLEFGPVRGPGGVWRNRPLPGVPRRDDHDTFTIACPGGDVRCVVIA
jgi:hypothetical protein